MLDALKTMEFVDSLFGRPYQNTTELAMELFQMERDPQRTPLGDHMPYKEVDLYSNMSSYTGRPGHPLPHQM